MFLITLLTQKRLFCAQAVFDNISIQIEAFISVVILWYPFRWLSKYSTTICVCSSVGLLVRPRHEMNWGQSLVIEVARRIISIVWSYLSFNVKRCLS